MYLQEFCVAFSVYAASPHMLSDLLFILLLTWFSRHEWMNIWLSKYMCMIRLPSGILWEQVSMVTVIFHCVKHAMHAADISACRWWRECRWKTNGSWFKTVNSLVIMNYVLCVDNVFIVSIFLYVFLLLAKMLFLTCADLNGTAEMPHTDRFFLWALCS